MSEENRNNENQNNENKEESLKDDWTVVGKGVGKTFMNLGKSLVKTAKVGVDVANDWVDGKESDNTAQKDEMKAEWKKFGHSFVDTAEEFGKAGEKSFQKGFESDGNNKEDAPEENKTEEDNKAGDNN